MERIAIIDITSKCNLRCTHCYNQERYWEKSENYKELNSKNVAKIVHRLKEMNFTRLHLLGGEPLLSSNLFDFILNGQKEDLDVSIVTNGTLLNSDMMKKLCNSGVWSLSVSLDGTTALVNDRIRGEGVFNKVVDNIKKSVEIKNSLQPDMRLGISFTLTKQNLDTSKNLFDFVNDLNLDFVNISYLSNEGKARETYYDNTITESDKFQFIDEILFSYKSRNNNIYFNIDARKLLGEYIYKKHGISLDAEYFVGCAGGDAQFYILADGTLLPCSPAGTSMGCQLSSDYLKDLEPPNLLLNNINEIINSSYLVKFYNYTHNAQTYQNIVQCKNCRYECKPCPLLYKNDNIVVKECTYAMEEIQKIDKKFMNIPLKKNENIRMSTVNDKVILLSFLTQDEFVLENTALSIWNQINNVNTGNDITRLIMKEYKLKDEDFNMVQKDTMEFLYQLRGNRFISDVMI